ncbi:MAG: chemotaxis protein CheX [Deltaproteobacteria bacterium]|nr:chemotaxis protein CheX [Deltaproteobacteria bacterium]
MRLDYINPFVEATHNVLEDVIKTIVHKGKLSLSGGPVASRGLLVVIGLTGDAEGQVLFDMEAETAVKIACIMNDKKFDSVQPMVIDSIAELVNIITGKVLTILNDKGFNLRLTSPMVFTGNATMSSGIRLETLVVPFATDYGEFVVNVAVRPAG